VIPTNDFVLSVEGMSVSFATEHGRVNVTEGVSFHVGPKETVGLVGESGCGKSVTALSIMRLIPDPPGRIDSGRVLFDGQDLASLSEAEMSDLRGNKIAMVFQEPMTSLDPAFTVGEQIAEVVRRHTDVGRAKAWARAVETLGIVGIPNPSRRADDYPHSFSGGMRQRVMIAMALALEPKLLIADEPTTALDVTIQAQIIDLLRSLREQVGMSLLLVTHDLGVVAETCDRVTVMYAGQIIESASVDEIFYSPKHPYTQALFECLPQVASGLHLHGIPGTVPPPHAFPKACRFHPRCSFAVAGRCDTLVPSLEEFGSNRLVRCLRAHELALPGVAGAVSELAL
jgi:oligopeptide/dipeptide ABC transporter ATP-binding protein